MRTAIRGVLALLTVASLLGSATARQRDPLQDIKQRQEIEAQKLQAYVDDAILYAGNLARKGRSVAALDYLVKVVGSDRVVLGTDYPMGMGDFDTVSKVMQLGGSAFDREQILGVNACHALNL
jgi:microsomal dipeptidase-like Zn-dependent dipeptidase